MPFLIMIMDLNNQISEIIWEKKNDNRLLVIIFPHVHMIEVQTL